jgi:hypothetical protein
MHDPALVFREKSADPTERSLTPEPAAGDKAQFSQLRLLTGPEHGPGLLFVHHLRRPTNANRNKCSNERFARQGGPAVSLDLSPKRRG